MSEPRPRSIDPRELGIKDVALDHLKNLFVLRDQRGRVLWKLQGNTPEENEQLGTRNIQGLFLEKFPEFNELFPRGEDGKIAEEKAEEAKNFIMHRVGSYRGSVNAFSRSPLSISSTPYFEGKHSIIISKSFSSWGLVFETAPQEDKESQRFIDKQGESWVTQKSFCRRYGVDSKAFKARIEEGIKAIEGKAIGGKTTLLYNEKDLTERFKVAIDFKKLPQVSRETGVYTDEKNVRWTTLGYFAEVHGIDRLVFFRYVKHFNMIEGRSKSGQAAALYNEAAALLELKDFLDSRSLPQVDKSSGQYIDKHGKAWTSLNYFHSKYKISYDLLKSQLEEVDVMMGLDKSGHQAVLYKVDEAQEKLMGLVDLPKLDRKTGKYTDSSGRVWIPKRNIRNRYKVGQLKGLKDKVPTIEGRDRGGKKRLLYDEEKVKDFIEKVYLLQIKQKRNFWTPEQIESAALDILKKTGAISYLVLRNLGRFDLSVAISRKYPGGFPALREKLKISRNESLLSPEEANIRLEEFFEKGEK